jgi:hypothetical protein
VNFTSGDHGSLLSPTSSAATTVEMQTETVRFNALPTHPIEVVNPAVVEP